MIHDIKNNCGYKLFCYTINDISVAKELLNMGMDAFCTDSLDLFKDFIW